MLRLAVFSCLVFAVFAAGKIHVEFEEAPLERAGVVQNFNAGKRIAGDKLIFAGNGNQVIDFAKEILVDLPFPQSDATNNAVISAITASTMLDAGTTKFSIVSGGVGQKKVLLRIVSTAAHKVSYTIRIYGK